MAHGSIKSVTIAGIGFDADPECDINIMPPFTYGKKATTGQNTTKATKQVAQITGTVLQFPKEKDKALLYDLLSPEDQEHSIEFASGDRLYINGTFKIEESSSQEGSVGVTFEPSVPYVWG